MNLQFEQRIRRLNADEFLFTNYPGPTDTAQVSLSEGHGFRNLTRLYAKNYLFSAYSLDGTQSQMLYTTRTQERSSGARNIRSPRNQADVKLPIITKINNIFCPDISRQAFILTNDYADVATAQSIHNPYIVINRYQAQPANNTDHIPPPSVTSTPNSVDTFVVPETALPIPRETSTYVSLHYTFEISYDLRRVYVYATDLITGFYTAKTISGAVSKFALDVSTRLGLPYTNIYPIVKQWLLDSEQPMLSVQAGSEFTLYMIPRVFTAAKFESLKHIIVQRFDVLEVDFTKVA